MSADTCILTTIAQMYEKNHIWKTRTYQFPSCPWAGALDRYKGLSARVQSRLDGGPRPAKNERTNDLEMTQGHWNCLYSIGYIIFN